MTTPVSAPAATPSPSRQDLRLRKAAQELEASFLKEMLRAAGLSKLPEGFGGGAGEEHFASFLVEAQARQMVAAGGIGLAEVIFESLKEDAHGPVRPK